MARPLRIEIAGALYYIHARGADGAVIVADDGDRVAFTRTLAHVIDRFGWRCHGACLLDDHYRLVVETPKVNLARAMRQLGGMYTQTFNHRHGHTGPVFQGRYKAVLVEAEVYLAALVRDVVRRPVSLGLVAEAADWAWSSHRATAGLEARPKWLTTADVLAAMTVSRAAAPAAWNHYVAGGSDATSVEGNITGQIYLGSPAFIARTNIAAREPARQRSRMTLASYRDGAGTNRHGAMARAYLDGGYTLAEVAAAFDVHYATVSRAAKAAEAMAK